MRIHLRRKLPVSYNKKVVLLEPLKYNSFLTQRLSEKGPWLNIDRTLTKIGEMLEAEDDQENKEILHELQKKLKKITF